MVVCNNVTCVQNKFLAHLGVVIGAERIFGDNKKRNGGKQCKREQDFICGMLIFEEQYGAIDMVYLENTGKNMSAINNNNKITFQEADIRRVYGETIFYRGQDYFDDDRVTSVIKFKNKLTGEVEGSDTYRTEVDLNDMRSECSLPLRHQLQAWRCCSAKIYGGSIQRYR